MKSKNFVPGILAITALVAIASVVMASRFKPAFRNSAINPPVSAAEISMKDARGSLFRMSDLRGNVVLLYFGFVNCPKECPLTMAHVKLALEQLGAQSADVRLVMVSTDPLRDTPEALNDFLSTFNADFIGVPGTADQLTKIWNDYNVQVLEGGETHSSFTYVVDRSGKQRLNFLPDSPPEDIAHDLKILLAEK